jgi:hypothetical protein
MATVTDTNITQFPRRRRRVALSNRAALDWLQGRRAVEADSYASLGDQWGWERSRTSKALKAWAKAGEIELEEAGNGGRGGKKIRVRMRETEPQIYQEIPAVEIREIPAFGVAQHVAQDVAVAGGNAGNSRLVRLAAQAAGQQMAQLIEFPPVGRFVEPPAEPPASIMEARSDMLPSGRARRTAGPPSDPPVPDPAVERRAYRGGGIVSACTLVAALALAGVSGWFSITGLTAIFVGAFWPVIVLGAAFECGKLAAVSWLGRYGALASWPLQAALVALVIALMGLDVIGAYGFLSRAQIEHSVIGDAAIEARETQVQAKLDVQAGVVADLDKRIGQIDGAVEKATAKGRTNSAMVLAQDQKRNRADLVRERQREADTLANMKAEEAGLSAQRRVAAADLGPVRYLAVLAGVPADEMLRWFVLLVAMLLDPAAVLLLFAAASGRKA